MHHFKSDIINNMDHMRIAGTELSSMIIESKQHSLKSCLVMLQTAETR